MLNYSLRGVVHHRVGTGHTLTDETVYNLSTLLCVEERRHFNSHALVMVGNRELKDGLVRLATDGARDGPPFALVCRCRRRRCNGAWEHAAEIREINRRRHIAR